MDESNTIGDRLKGYRRERALTQYELAERAGVSKDIIAKLEQGQRTTARVATLGLLANALGITLSALLGRRERLERAGSDGVLAVRDAILSAADLYPGVDQADGGEPVPPGSLEAAGGTVTGGGISASWRRRCRAWSGRRGLRSGSRARQRQDRSRRRTSSPPT
jgi:transcriptional regulator with XRE-family HTH domain